LHPCTRRFLVLAAQALCGCVAGEVAPAPAPDPITGEQILAHVSFLADDRLEGRMTGEKGCDEAATYVAGRFTDVGLEAGGDLGLGARTWLQHFLATSGRRLEPATSCELGGRGLELGKEFAVAIGMGTASGAGELCFAGYGLHAPEANRDDWAGLDAPGKVVVILAGAPGRAANTGDFLDTRPAARHVRPRAKIEQAFARKAAGLVMVEHPRENPELAEKLPEWVSDRGEGLTFPAVHVTASVGRALLEQAGLDLDALVERLDAGETIARPLPGLAGAIRVETSPIRRPAANVIGLLKGSGEHGEEHLIVGAHYDHLGYGGSGSLSQEKAIHNGADDNASGTAALLEIAERMATGPPPARTIVFVAFSGEELGLLGSQHYVRNPVLPLAKCCAMLNLDMVGRSRDGYCAAGAAGSSPVFRGIVEKANDELGLGLKLELSDGGMTRGSSDHQSFLDASVPSLFFFSGLHEDYHKPSDDLDKLNADGAARIARLCEAVVRALDALPEKPAFVAPPPPAAPHAGVVPAPSSGTRPWFGSIPSFGGGSDGVLFDGVSRGSPAEKAGLQKGDTLVEWNGRPVKTLEDFTACLNASQVGDTVKVVVLRSGERREFTVTLAVRP
jgi:hypothetical protein